MKTKKYIFHHIRVFLLYADMKKVVLNKKYDVANDCYYEINVANSDVQEEYGIFKFYKK